MRKIIISTSLIIASLIMISCGPSQEEIRQQEIKDSIQLEADRKDLLDRANRMFDRDETTAEKTEETED